MKLKVKITLTEEMLGTRAANPEVFASFIASKHPSGTPQKDELDQPENKEEAGTTIFSRDKEGNPGLFNYCVKGFFKDAANAMNRFDKEERDGLDKLAAYKTKIDGCVFVEPRFIPIIMPEGGKIGICERPLRAETAQGPRISVVRSETVPIGSTLEFELNILSKELVQWVRLWLDYGKLKGLGCWRNSGRGSFSWEEIKA